MMYTFLNACRQTPLPPFIRTTYESSQSRACFHLCIPSVQTFIRYMEMETMQFSVFRCLHNFVIYQPNSTRIQGPCTHIDTRLNAILPSLAQSLHLICSQYSLSWWTEVIFVYQVSFIKFKKTSEPPHNLTLYNNEIKNTMKDNNEHWLA